MQPESAQALLGEANGSDRSGISTAGLEWDCDLFRVTQEQLRNVAGILELDDDHYVRLAEPRRSMVVNLPIRMDGGELINFTGYRVQHLLTMGPTKGGLRFAPSLSLGQCAALAMLMT